MEFPSILSITLQLLLLTAPITAQSTSSVTSALSSSVSSSSRSASASAATTLSQTATQSAPSSTSTAKLYPGNAKWGYFGCQNETTGFESTNFARALAGMEQTKSDDMTVESCFNICNARGTSYAGLEYSSECFCSNHVNALSAKLADSECNLACSGNSSQVCGGSLKLTVYSVKTQQQIDADKKGAGMKAFPQASSLALGVAMVGMLYLA